MKQEQCLLMEFLLIFIVMLAWATYTKKKRAYTHTENKTNYTPPKKNPHFISS